MRFEQHIRVAFPVEPQPDHIHTPNDGKGPRRVYVDGQFVANCTYADTQRGLVHYHLSPVRLNRRRTGVRWAKKIGRVDVETIPYREFLYGDFRTWVELQLRRARLFLTGWNYDGAGRWSRT